MEENFGMLIEEAIKLELYVSDLYLLFSRKFHEDAEFWWQIAIEEQNHAALLKTVLQMKSVDVEVPTEIVPPGLDQLVQSNERLIKAIKAFEENPDRIRAFQFAYGVEHSAGELHYENFMKYAKESKLNDVFRRLNGDDINHAERIQQYMIDHGIPRTHQSNAGL